MVVDYELKLKADKLFWIFEELFFENIGNYPRKTNLILEFSEFILNATKSELEEYVTFTSDDEVIQLKKYINQGIDAWLDKGTLKTLLI